MLVQKEKIKSIKDIFGNIKMSLKYNKKMMIKYHMIFYIKNI